MAELIERQMLSTWLVTHESEIQRAQALVRAAEQHKARLRELGGGVMVPIYKPIAELPVRGGVGAMRSGG